MKGFRHYTGDMDTRAMTAENIFRCKRKKTPQYRLTLYILYFLGLFFTRKSSFTSPLLTHRLKHYRLEYPVQKACLINVTTAVSLLTM